MSAAVAVVLAERLARYSFGDGHPFGPDRYAAFVREFEDEVLTSACSCSSRVAPRTRNY